MNVKKRKRKRTFNLHRPTLGVRRRRGIDSDTTGLALDLGDEGGERG